MQDDVVLAIATFAERIAAAASELAGVARAAATDGAAPEEPVVSGKRQRLVVEVLVDAAARQGRDGLKVAEIAEAMRYDDQPNTLLALRALEKKDIAELVPGQSPQRWRLTERYGRSRRVWSRDELIVAMHHYVASQGGSRHVDAERIKEDLDRVALRDGQPGRTIGSINYKLGNLQAIETDGRAGFPHYGSRDKEVWAEFVDHRAALGAAAEAILHETD
jgi:hypothetical protein